MHLQAVHRNKLFASTAGHMYVAVASIACMHNVLLALTEHLACVKLAYKCKPRFATLGTSNEAQLLT